MITALLFCANLGLSQTQALYVLNHLSQYSYRECICAREAVPIVLEPLPEHPTSRYIAEHPSRYSLDEVMRAINILKHQRGEQ